MGGSTRRTRRRAAGPALRYDHVPGARTREQAEARREPWGRRLYDKLFGVLVFLAVLATVAVFALADMAWGETLWGDLAPAWPGGGYGFSVTTGLLAPPAVVAIAAPLKGIDWKADKARSLARAAAALPGAALSCLLLLICLGAFRPRRNRDFDCYSHGEPCWVHEQYPYLGLPGTAALVGSAVGCWLVHRYVRRRRAD
ncbi:hypothetical protein ACFWZ2_23555 [Streptomyces sp. NPDC059002]|uniref:hypothetical protein n=1 Tax=Streptomyces sp. NPDC059002 TaxID=3346690 RepID=UPI003696FA0F